jgi:ubiquitin C-terminal hydrolase
VKRFETGLNGQTIKLNDRFTIDHELYIEHNNYILTSIIHHHGRNPNSGHYTVDTRREGKWYKINDDCIFEIDSNNIGSETAYVLVYNLFKDKTFK